MADDPRPAVYVWRDLQMVEHCEPMTVGQAIDRAISDMRRVECDRYPLGVFTGDGIQIVSQTRLADLMAEQEIEEARHLG